MRHLSESTSRVAKENFSRKYIALGRIVNCWVDIIGADMANYAQPVKLNTRKALNKRSKPECVLDIACSSSHAMMLQYQKPVILERMTTIFGQSWVSDIRFVPVSKSVGKIINKPVVNRRPLTDRDNHYIEESIEYVQDDCIRQRLERMGQYILMESSVS